MDNGFIKLHRKLLNWEWLNKPEMVALFIHFLLLANHKEGKWQGEIIKPGQFITGLTSLREQTGLSIQTIRSCITRLKSTGELTNKSTNKFRLITLTNWHKYQINQQAKQATEQQTTNKQLTANKNIKNEKNVLSAKAEETSLKTGQQERKPNPVFELMARAEKRRGQAFTKNGKGKQLKSIKNMFDVGITEEKIIERWLEMEENPFWQDKGFDFKNVEDSFSRK